MNRRVTAAVLLAAVFTAASAGAQTISLEPENPARWDLFLHAGWLGGNKGEIAADWNDWYDAASFGASAGYHWTSHLKVELDLATSTAGAVTTENPVVLPDGRIQYFRPREHEFRTTQASGGIAYQFFENRWFHPFAGGGITMTHETERAEYIVPVPYFRDPQTHVPLPPLEAVARDTTSVHPFATAGFKAYITEHAFIRSDVRAMFSSDRAEWLVWRGGVGVDF